MLAFLFASLVIAWLDVCYALGGLRYVRPPSSGRNLRGRAGLESIEEGIVWSNGTNATASTNSTAPSNAAIIPVVLSEDQQCVTATFIKLADWHLFLHSCCVGHTTP